MKSLLKIISTLLTLLLLSVFALSAFWFLNDQGTREKTYNQTVAKLTGSTFDETFSGVFEHDHADDNNGVDNKKLTMDDVKDDSVLEHSKRHADPTYVCPMHAQVVKDVEGSCPICGMDLVLKEVEIEEEPEPEPVKAQLTMDDVKDDSVLEHSKRHSDPTYVCPMHPQIVKGEEGSCPICGMDLVEKEQEPIEEEEETSSAKKEKKILYWVAPMDANYRRDEPGQSPMGMDLVPVYDQRSDEPKGDGFPKIRINASTAQNMGVRIEKAQIRELSRTIKTIGSVTYNEDSLYHIHSRANGWVEKVFAKSLGDPVTEGKALLEFYSPDILAAQKDLLIAKRAGSSLSQASRTRLLDLNVPPSVIDEVSKTGKAQNRIPIVANHSGVVTRIGIKNGMYITPKTEIYTIADLSSVWIIVDVFEHQLTWVKIGNRAEIKVQSVPSKVWKGKVDYIYPELNPKTRTLKVRISIDTPEQLLKPNMFTDVTLFTDDKKVLSVPAESIIYYENSPRIVKVVAKNRYQPIEIKIGMKSGGQVEIIEGIVEGDNILVSGQFMIDSESNLQASFRRLLGK